jgi:hypothetical protein
MTDDSGESVEVLRRVINDLIARCETAELRLAEAKRSNAALTAELQVVKDDRWRLNHIQRMWFYPSINGQMHWALGDKFSRPGTHLRAAIDYDMKIKRESSPT